MALSARLPACNLIKGYSQAIRARYQEGRNTGKLLKNEFQAHAVSFFHWGSVPHGGFPEERGLWLMDGD